MQERKGTEGNADPQALILYAQAEAQQPHEKVGTVSRIKCAHLTVSLHLAGVGHVAVPHVVTVRHVAHYRADLASPKRRARLTGRGGIRGRIFPDIWETGPEPGISLEGAKASPRPGFDSCP
jgi:hypothetical protein